MRHGVLEIKSDEMDLIEKAQAGCRESTTILYERFVPMIMAEAAKQANYHNNVTMDDAIQESSLYFLECLRSFSAKEANGRGLRYWAKTCVGLRMIDFWKRETIIHTPMHVDWKASSDIPDKVIAARRARTFSHFAKSDSENKKFARSFIDKNAQNPATEASHREEAEVLSYALSKMDKVQRAVVKRRLAGDTYEQAGEAINNNKRLNVRISPHREVMRQRSERAFLELKNRMLNKLGRKIID